MRGGLGIGWSTLHYHLFQGSTSALPPLVHSDTLMTSSVGCENRRKLFTYSSDIIKNKYINPVCCIPNIQLSSWENHKSFHNVCNMLKVLLLAHFHIIFSKYVLCESCDMMKANSVFMEETSEFFGLEVPYSIWYTKIIQYEIGS